MTSGDITRTAMYLMHEQKYQQVASLNEDDMPIPTPSRCVPVREVINPYSGVHVLIIGSSYEDCEEYVAKKYAGQRHIFNTYFVWNEGTLHCHDGLKANCWHKTDSADFYLWVQAMELYIPSSKPVSEKIPTETTPSYDESDLVPCQFHEFHVN